MSFVDGASTAGWHAKLAKKNEQAAPDAELSGVQSRVVAALQGSPAVMAACLPCRMSRPLISRYVEGMAYGNHIDDAIRPGEPPMRADISFTLFLAEPDSYAGGELVTISGGIEARFKLPTGAAVFYPSDTLHRVEPVTSGQRLAAVGWMQSMVRAPDRRQVLYDLDTARRQVFETGAGPLFDTLSKTHSNLLRMWAEL